MSKENNPSSVSLTKIAETTLLEPRPRFTRPLVVGALALGMVTGAGWIYHEKTADPCSETFKLAPETASENVLATRDGMQFKLLIGQDKRDLTQLRFLVYGAHDKPAAFDTFSGDVPPVDVAPTDMGPGPEATFTIDNDTKLQVDVTRREVKTQCVAVSPVVAQH